MKLLIFAHKPPPHHGQSYMVQLLLDNLGGDVGQQLNEPEGGKGNSFGQGSAIECYHVNSRVSKGLEDVGRMRLSKVLPLFKYCAQAIWCRLRYGVRCFYYIPSPPGSRSALYRDWVVMALCRPFFDKVIFHWHAAGLGDWLAQSVRPWQRAITEKLLGRPELSIVLTEYNRSDGVELRSKRTVVVPNGIPDPCPEFERDVLPGRIARAQGRLHAAKGGNGIEPFQVLFISLCTASKGLFDVVQAVVLLEQKMTPIRAQLTVAGNFADSAERQKFEGLMLQHNRSGALPLLRYVGFVAGEQKKQLFLESDCLCFPTYYSAESFGLVLVEAMAFGLPIITTRWRSIPELLPGGYPGVVDPQAPDQIAGKLREFQRQDYDPALRAHFLANYTVAKFSEGMKKALLSL